MNKLVLLLPAAMLMVGVYLLLLVVRGGELVEVIPGHQVPPRFAVMFALIALFGGIAVGVEMLVKARKQASPRT